VRTAQLFARRNGHPGCRQPYGVGWRRTRHRSGVCYLAHEIGDGFYYAYIWGEQVRRFLRLAAQGHIVVSNLHADTLQETRDQLVGANGALQAHLDAVTLKVFLGVRRTAGWSMQRWVQRVYESDGTRDRLVWTGTRGQVFARVADSARISPSQEQSCAQFLAALDRQGIRHIDAVRRAVLQHPSPSRT
jgi:hypothetical protein